MRSQQTAVAQASDICPGPVRESIDSIDPAEQAVCFVWSGSFAAVLPHVFADAALAGRSTGPAGGQERVA